MPANQPRRWDKGFIPFRLEVLTPVFIGCGEALSPLEYVIRKEGGKARLYRIDLQSWLMDHAADQSVQNVIATGDISRIRRMLDEKLDEKVYAVSSSPIEDMTLADELLRAFAGQQDRRGGFQKDKTGDVDAALRNPVDGGLYIPGSSLKGAMSTPLIDWLDGLAKKMGRPTLKDANHRDSKRGMNDRLKEMFGSISDHAMQALKVSDIAAPFTSCAVVRAREMSRKPEKKGTPKNPCEVIMPGSGDMWGRLMLDCSSGTPCITLPSGTKLALPDITRHCNTFYQKRFMNEAKGFYLLPHFKAAFPCIKHIGERVLKLDGNTMLLRVGHYSHVECVTVENNQPQTRKGKNGTPMPSGTTRTLADGKAPFGWVLLHFCSQEEYEKGLAEAETQRLAAVKAQSAQLLAMRREAQAKAEQAATLARQQEERRLAAEQKAAEEKQKQEELARRMAELTPEEARLFKLTAEPSEALSMEIFNEMKAWNPELQRKAAEALRDCWTALGKWNGKQSKKQEAKVKEVKALLE